ncbi:MAG: arsenate reductase ArsC [Candidatus Marinimicrobia bacterium]|jgi:arsenate reductase|nr:arsenate reductase ArsC [Candidatus Neomarinimicrobiota bacterium]
MPEKKKVLFICTGNACRSQIAHGLLRDMASNRFDVFSAGSHPSRVHSTSIAVMEEIGIDISHHTSDYVDDYLDKGIDIAITVCDNANQSCPTFPGDVERIHWSIDDPFRRWNFDTNQMDSFRETRTEIKSHIESFLDSH